MRYIIFSFLYGITWLLGAQSLSADFSIWTDEVCLNENVVLIDSTENAISHNWDFCLSEFREYQSTQQAVSGLSEGYGISVVNDDGVWFGFIVDRTNNILIRADFGESLDNSPDFHDLGNPGGLFDRPEGISIVHFNGEWIGVVGAQNAGIGVIKLFFGDTLTNPISSEKLEIPGTAFDGGRIRQVELHQQSDSLILLANHYNPTVLLRINFRDSFSNSITESDVYSDGDYSDLYRRTGFDIQQVDGEYIAHLISEKTGGINRVLRWNFGVNLLSTPVLEAQYSLSENLGIYDLVLQQEGNSFYGVIPNDGTNLMVYDFGDLKTPKAPELIDYPVPLPSIIATDLFRVEGVNRLFGVRNNGLYIIDFEKDCFGSIEYSTEVIPQGLSYSSPGQKPVWLEVTGVDGSSASHIDTLNVLNSESPDIDFIIDSSRCVSNINHFTAQSNSSEDIATYQWIFGEDTLAASVTASDTMYQFPTSSDYLVTLIIHSLDGCTNTVSNTVSIYDGAPAGSFDMTGTLCSDTEIVFNNTTDETGYGGNVGYYWDFNGEGTSSNKNPSFSFSSSGTKEVKLVTIIPGCTDTTAVQIDLDTGPTVDFIWTNNCFGDTIQFLNLTSGDNVTNYHWDFGNGDESHSVDTSYKYVSAGSFNVTLTVENAMGCITSTEKLLQVNDQSLITFNFSGTTVNLPTEFEGADLTLSGDQIISWEWDVDQQEEVASQNTSFVFTSSGEYEARLFIETEQGCQDTTSQLVSIDEAVYPTAYFEVAESVCIEEQATITNLSVNGNRYQWDLCLSGFTSMSDTSWVFGELANGYGIDLVEDNNEWFAFVVDQTQNKLLRLEFGNSPLNTPVVSDLGNPGDLLNQPEEISILNFEGQWIGVVGNVPQGGGVVKLFFGDALTNQVSAEKLDFPGTTYDAGRTRRLKLLQQADSLVLLVNYYNPSVILRLSFGDSFSNLIGIENLFSSGNFADLYRRSDFDVQIINGEYIIHVVSEAQGDINTMVRFNFHNDLFAVPTREAVYTLNLGSDIYDFELMREGNQFYGIFGSGDDLVRIYEFGDLVAPSVPSEITPSNLLSNMVAFHGLYLEGVNYLMGVNGDNLHLITVNESCPESNTFRIGSDPGLVSWSFSNEKPIWLAVENELGNSDHYVDTVIVTPSTAPAIAFTHSQSLCVSTPTQFTSSDPSGDVVSYSWDFDGDGIEDSSDPNPSYQFPTPGTYNVRLSVVSDGGCDNFTEEEITIYPEPPTPLLAIGATTYCTETEILLENLTNDLSYDGHVEYIWTITGLSDTITTNDLTLAFDTPGEKTIQVFSRILGCESAVTKDTIVIDPSPMIDFQGNTVCEGETTVFANTSLASTYAWDFGDGAADDIQQPQHEYASAGNYQVELTITDEFGCSSSLSKEIVVSSVPNVLFEHGLLCEGDSIVFQDLSTVEGSSMAAWDWSVDGVLTDSTKHPTLFFNEIKTYDVELLATAENGCSETFNETVEVLDMPEVDFTVTKGCLKEVSIFDDTTPNQSFVASRKWMVDGILQSQSGGKLNYAFANTGSHEVTLIVDYQNLCSSSITKSLNILKPPQIAFDFTKPCENESILVFDLTSEFDDLILSRKWYVDNEIIGTDSSVSLPPVGPGIYEVKLQLETQQNCTYELDRQIHVFKKPEASFDVSADYGIPPFGVTIDNMSENSVGYNWLVNGSLVSSLTDPTFSFTEEGDQEIKLIALSENECYDTTSIVIISAKPQVDLIITDLRIVEGNDTKRVIIDVLNNSNLPIQTFNADVTFEGSITFSESITNRINQGETSELELNFGLPSSSNVNYVCVTLSSEYGDVDLNSLDNESCITVEPSTIFENPYPNPTSGNAKIRMVLPSVSDVGLTIMDLSGNIRYQSEFLNRPEGLNVFEFNLETLSSGTYFVKMKFNGGTHIARIIKE